MARPMPSRMRTDREFRRKVMLQREAAEARGQIERWIHQMTHWDTGTPQEVSPPAKPQVVPFSRKRKPIFKGGVVIGRRENYGTA